MKVSNPRYYTIKESVHILLSCLLFCTSAAAEETITEAQLIITLQASDLNKDNSLTRDELVQAYFHPETNPEHYPLQVYLLEHFDWFENPASHSTTLESAQNTITPMNIPVSAVENKPEMMWDQLIPENDLRRNLFTNGLTSINPRSVYQRGSSNCEVISAISSLARTQKEQRLILSYFHPIDASPSKSNLSGRKN